MDEDKYFDLEDVYDNEISPLMAKIIDICKKNRIPMVASFCYLNTPDDNALCTTALPFGERQPEKMGKAVNELYKKNYSAVAITVSNTGGKNHD